MRRIRGELWVSFAFALWLSFVLLFPLTNAWSFRHRPPASTATTTPTTTTTSTTTTWHIQAPPNPSRIRFLLISFGTRGDVQPYIAVCLTLLARGHSCRLATHTDYREWIESYTVSVPVAERASDSTPVEGEEKVVQRRIEYRPLGGSGAMIRELMQSLSSNGFANMRNMGLFPRMASFLSGVYDDAWLAAHALTQDLELSLQRDVDVILGINWVHIGQHVAEKLRIPYVEIQAFPNTPTSDHPLYFFENHFDATLHKLMPQRWSSALNKWSYKLADWVITTVGPIHLINRFRKRTLGLPPLRTRQLQRRQRSIPMIYGISPNVFPKPRDWNDRVHLVGYWGPPAVPLRQRRPSSSTGSVHSRMMSSDSVPSQLVDPLKAKEEISDSKLPPDLVSFLHQEPSAESPERLPVVYVGFGSMTGTTVEKLLRRIVGHVQKLHQSIAEGRDSGRAMRPWLSLGRKRNTHWIPFRMIFSTHREAKSIPRVDGRTIYHLNQAVPHSQLFPRMDLVVHHGGAGTLSAAVNAGVPSVIRPFIGDQFLWCKRIVALQVGQCSASFFMFRSFHNVIRSIQDALSKLPLLKKKAVALQQRVQQEDVEQRTWEAIHGEVWRIVREQEQFPGLSQRVAR